MAATRTIRRMDELLDVDDAAKAEGTVLVYQEATGLHVYETVEAAGASSLTDLTDVTGSAGFGKSPVDDGSGVFPLTRVTTEDDLNGILQIVADVDYHRFGDPGEPPLQNGFADYGPPYAPARWRLTANNVLRLDGAVTRPDPLEWPTVIATLPEGCRPDTTHVFMAPSDQSISRIDVDAGGNITWYVYLVPGGSGAQGYLSLSTVSYSVANPGPPPTIP